MTHLRLAGLALLGLVLNPISPNSGTCIEAQTVSPKLPNGTVPFEFPNELNPDETTQPPVVWQNSPLTRQKKPQSGSTNICRCLACAHMTAQKTLVRFSSIGHVNPQTGLCHFPVPVPAGEPSEETTRKKYQFLGNPKRGSLSWVKLGTAPNATFLISKLNGRKVYLARLNLGPDLMAFGTLDPKLPELLLTHNVSTRNTSLIEKVELLTFRLPRKQVFFLETPPLELNPDEVEYRVQLTDEPNLKLDLSCQVNSAQSEKSEPENETIFLQLYRKDRFPFKWVDVWLQYRWTLNRDWYSGKPWGMGPFSYHVDTVSTRRFNICRSTASNGDILYGMLEPGHNLSESDVACLPCTVYQGGQQWNVSNYEVLYNPKGVKVDWVEVPSWREIPSSAFITSLSPVEACNRNVGRITEKRYIGRVVSAGRAMARVWDVTFQRDEDETLPTPTLREVDSPAITRLVLNFPEGFKGEETTDKRVPSPFGFDVKLNESSVRQVLVAAPSGEQLITGLVCKKTNKHLDLSTFSEEVGLTVKMKGEKGGEMSEPRIQRIFQQAEPRQLVWRAGPDWNRDHLIPTQIDSTSDDDLYEYQESRRPSKEKEASLPYQTFICRYRCTGSNACPSSQVTVNGTTHTRTIDRTIGSFKLETSSASHEKVKKPMCWVAFDGFAYKTESFETLSNPCALKVEWTPAMMLPEGTLAVVNESQGEKVLIGRYKQRDGSYQIGQVAKGSGRITFLVFHLLLQFKEVGFSQEESVNAKVSLLTVEA